MANYLKLKSQVKEICDYTTIDISQFYPEFVPDEAQIEKDINRQLKRHGEKMECDTVVAEDFAVLTCHSENEKFCKNSITIPVGKGMFSAELEEKLIGMPVGQENTVTVDGVPVVVTVEKTTRTVLPELTDATVASWKMDGIETLADLRRSCIDRQIEGMLLECEEADMASAYLWQNFNDQCEFTLDEEEVEFTRKEAEEKLREMSEAPAAEFEDEEDVEEFEDEEDDVEAEDFDMSEMIYNMYKLELQLATVGQILAEQEGTLLTDEDYEAYIVRQCDARPNMTEEEIRAKYTTTDYMIHEYGDRLAVKFDGYVAECFKKALNK